MILKLLFFAQFFYESSLNHEKQLVTIISLKKNDIMALWNHNIIIAKERKCSKFHFFKF
jgi:hypothetical protein